MPQPQKSQIRQQLTSLISPQLIRRRARSLGVVKRRRVDPVALVYVLVLGFGHGRARTLALTSCDTAEIGHRLGEWSHGKSIDDKHRPSEARREADWIAHDTATLCDVGARLQARLLSTPRGALSDGAEQIIHRGLVGLLPVIEAMASTARAKLAPQARQAWHHAVEQSRRARPARRNALAREGQPARHRHLAREPRASKLDPYNERDDEPTAAHILYNLVDRRHGRA